MSEVGSTEELTEAKTKFLKSFKAMYSLPEETNDAVEKKLDSLNAQQMRELFRSTPGEVLEEIFNCEVCNDGRRIRLTNNRKERYFGKTFPCPKCTDEDDLVMAAGVPSNYAEWNLETLDFETPLVADSRAALLAGESIVMYGAVGRGKTHTAIGLLREWVKHGGITGSQIRPARFLYFPHFLDQMRQAFGSDEFNQQAQGLENELGNIDLLVIDDLGAERTSEWVIERVNVLLDRRLREGRQTIITTNVNDLGDVERRYGSRAASRLSGYRWFQCGGSDHRLLR